VAARFIIEVADEVDAAEMDMIIRFTGIEVIKIGDWRAREVHIKVSSVTRVPDSGVIRNDQGVTGVIAPLTRKVKDNPQA
jgi:hypothetical protein